MSLPPKHVVSILGTGNAHRSIVLLALCALATGCFGVQHGPAVTSSQTTSVRPTLGGLTVFCGGSPDDASRELHLACLVLCPGFTANSSGGGGDHGSFSSTQTYEYGGPAGNINESFTWNRVTDKVKIGGKTFSRSAGNVFVLIRGTNGKRAWQLQDVARDARHPAILRHIKEQLPEESLIQQLALPASATNKDA